MKRLFNLTKNGKLLDEEAFNRIKKPLLRASNHAKGLNFDHDKEYYKR